MRNSRGSFFQIAMFFIIAGFLAGCGTQPKKKGDLSERKIRAVATTGMIADAVTRIGGERLEVTGLMGAGVDPHLYKASEGDVEKMAEADIIFYNGLHLEGAMAEVFKKMGREVPTIAVGEAIDTSLLIRSKLFADAFDPHIWFDVSLWARAVEAVRDRLAELDSAHAEDYNRRALEYLQELAGLEDYVRSTVARIPQGERILVTAHDAFGYFGRAYGFEVRGLQGISTAAEAGTADVKELADFIVRRKIRAIFVESSVPRRNLEAVQAAVRARGLKVNIGGQLFSDALGSPGTSEGNYVGMVRYNVETIVQALLGET